MKSKSTPSAQDRFERLSCSLMRRVREAIPVTAQMGMKDLEFDGENLRLDFPLSSNTNDKGTAFAGSSYSLMVLSAWALVTLILEEAGEKASVVVVSASVEYPRPLTEPEPVAIAKLADGETAKDIVRRFRSSGKVKVQVEVLISDSAGKPAVSFRGLFAARRI